jgi:hypothetical protein
MSMETKKRINGDITQEEYEAWKVQMEKDGFKSLWTWMCWVIRQHIQRSQSK